MNILTVPCTAPDASRRFAEALKNAGFAVITDHPIPQDLIQEVFEEWTRLFRGEDKWNYKFDPGKQEGGREFKEATILAAALPAFRPEVRLSEKHTAGSFLRERLGEIGLVRKQEMEQAL